MNEQKLTELYKNEIENSAPDFDALWDRIETNLEPKTYTVKITPKKSPLKLVMAIAACAVCVLGVSLVSGRKVSFETTDGNSINSIQSDEAPAMDSIEQNDGIEEETQSRSESETPVLDYSSLNFTSYSETIMECTGKPAGDAYFVEENVLSTADVIIRGIVTRVYTSENGESLCYEMEVKESCPKTTETVVISSNSPYKMKRGREYLIPAARTADGYRTVFDNIPQIEFTAEGGIVYFNGWSVLDNDRTVDLIYPQKTVDDFFYDRMKFSYSGDITPLIEKFRHLKAM